MFVGQYTTYIPHTEAPPYIPRDCCDGGKNGYYSCDAYAYPWMFRGSLTM